MEGDKLLTIIDQFINEIAVVSNAFLVHSVTQGSICIFLTSDKATCFKEKVSLLESC